MKSLGRVSGYLFAAAGIIIGLTGTFFLISGVAGDRLTTSGAILGFGLGLIVVLPLLGGGIFLITRGGQEEKEMAHVEQQKKILNMVLAQGQVRIAEVALELNVTRDQVENEVRDLVGKNLFSGAISWKDGVLYSREASKMKADQTCPNCGSQVRLAGKGVVQCPSCGSQVFLSQ